MQILHGYRLIVQREGERVRLFTRSGHDWSGRYPLILEAALRNRNTSFVIDGEAVLLGRSGIGPDLFRHVCLGAGGAGFETPRQ